MGMEDLSKGARVELGTQRAGWMTKARARKMRKKMRMMMRREIYFVERRDRQIRRPRRRILRM
jgi:hypothetical protein